MKRVEMSGVENALQLTLGITDQGTVVMALERNPDSPVEGHWVAYSADAERARDIAAILLQGADLLDGKLQDHGQFDANADDCREHHA